MRRAVFCEVGSRSVAGRCSWVHWPTKNLDASTGNLQNTKDKRADRPANEHSTANCFHLLSVLHRCGWQQLQWMYGCAVWFVHCYRAHCVTSWFCRPEKKTLLSLCLHYIYIYIYIYIFTHTHCATSRKVAGSISDGVIGILHWHNPSACTMALRLVYL